MADEPESPKDPSDAAPAGEGDARERMDLPKWNRARVKRAAPADAPQADAFQQGVRDAGRAAVRRGPLVAIGLVVVAAGIGGGIWLRGRNAESAATSTRLLAQAASWRARGVIVDVDAEMKNRKRPPPVPIARDVAELSANVDGALGKLQSEAGGSKAESLAILVRAGQQVEAGDFPGAEQSYRGFLSQVGAGHELAFVAREGVVLAREGLGDLEGALGEVEAMLGQVGDFYRDQGLWHKARLLERLGRKDEALEVYRLYVGEYPLDRPSIARDDVRERLSELDPSAVPAAADGLGGLKLP